MNHQFSSAAMQATESTKHISQAQMMKKTGSTRLFPQPLASQIKSWREKMASNETEKIVQGYLQTLNQEDRKRKTMIEDRSEFTAQEPDRKNLEDIT